MTESALRLTNYRCFEDSSEIRYGLALWKDVLEQEVIKSELSTATRMFLTTCLRMDGPYTTWNDAYIACFCADSSSAMHFTDFGEVALDFELVGGLQRASASNLPQVLFLPQDCWLKEVEYVRQTQRAKLQNVVGPVVTFLNRNDAFLTYDGHRSELMSLCLQPVFAKIIELLPFFKDPQYANEREWRLVWVIHGDTHKHKNGIICIEERFRRLALRKPNSDQLPIRNVRFSPTLDASKRQDGEHYAKQQGYSVEV